MKNLKALIVGSCIVLISCLSAPLAANGSDYVTYKIEANDTLLGIAQRYLVNQQSARQVQRFNRISNPRRLRIGSTLRIPRRLLAYRDVRLSVATFSGPVTIDGQAPQRNQQLSVNDRIVTRANGFITFNTSFGGRISLPSNTAAQLKRSRRYTLGNALDVDFLITRGRANISSPSLNDQDRLQMRTPLAVTAVRGTDFRIGFDPESGEFSLTEVTEGAVNVAAGDEERAAPAGFGIASTPTGVNPPEELLPAPAVSDPGAIQTGETLDFALEPVAGARGYRVQLARDAGFVDVVSERVIDTEETSFPALDDGRYFVRARAIAQSGLEGQSEAYPFLRKQLGVGASAAASIDDSGYTFAWFAQSSEDGSAPVTFAFQMWSEDAPDVLLVDEVGLSVTELALTDLAPARYQWRVAAISTDPQEGLIKVWGAPQTLVVSD